LGTVNMALGAQNKQQMAPAQFVARPTMGQLVGPGQYSATNYDAAGFRPQETSRMVQDALQNQTRIDDARSAAEEADTFRTVNNILSTLDKSQPAIDRMKLEESVKVNRLINSELQAIDRLYQQAYKGNMKAQEQLSNFTFSNEILQSVPVEQYSQLKDVLGRAQLSVANNGMTGAMNRVKLGLKNMVENLVGENDPDAAALASVIARAVSQSGDGAIQPELLEEIQNRVKVFKVNNPNSKAVDLGIVDNFRTDLETSGKNMLAEKVYGDRSISPREASAVIGNLTKLIESDPAMDPMEKTYYKSVIQGLLDRSGLTQTESGFTPMPGQMGTPGAPAQTGTNPALDMLQKALDRLK